MNTHLFSTIGVGGLIFDDKREKILLCKKNYGIIKDKWTFPEGYVEKGESPPEALWREVGEELNGDIVVEDLLAARYKKGEKGVNVYFVFACDLLNANALKINDGEISDFKFFEINEAAKNNEVYSLVKVLLAKMTNKKITNFQRVDFSPPELGLSKNNYLLFL